MWVVDGISSIWNFCQISSCEILAPQKSYFFRCFLPFFCKSPQNLKMQQVLPKTSRSSYILGIVQFDCNTLANTTQFCNSSPNSIWQISLANLQSKSRLLRLRHRLFEMALGDPQICIFYLTKSVNMFYLSCRTYIHIYLSIYLSFCLSINLSICLSIHPVHPVHPVYPIYPVYLSICVSIYRSFYRSIVYRSIDLSIYRSNPILSNLI
jgi:hypothetical protein